MPITTCEFEVTLPVADYFHPEGSRGAAFDSCREDFEKAVEMARAELQDAFGNSATSSTLLNQVEVRAVRFLEFDSFNISHASGYFLMEIVGKQEVVKIIQNQHQIYATWEHRKLSSRKETT